MRGSLYLVSQVLGPSVRRLYGDMRAAHGYPLLPVESFVDISRASGTCHGAKCRRLPGTVHWHCHLQSTEIFVFDLTGTFPEEMRISFGLHRRSDRTFVSKPIEAECRSRRNSRSCPETRWTTTSRSG